MTPTCRWMCACRPSTRWCPADADASGLPVAVLRYRLRNRTAAPLRAAVCGVLPNFIGMDPAHP